MATSTRRKRARLDKQVLERQVRICKAFANVTRLHMLDLLGDGEWAIAHLQRALGITKPNLSQHLAILRAAGIVTTRRKGKHIYCSLAMPEVKRVCHQFRDILRAQIRSGRNLPV
ncbi:MAG: metalloregulator ArsR/SmtB family transcription factor [Acidobacteriia bacterium]|nr:metalloregulator ArsR/SmtB family transcription factor [Terriglobia bacterium]